MVRPSRDLSAFRPRLQPLEDRVTPAVTVSALDLLFDTDGKQTYNAAGTNQDDNGRAVAVQSDGKIVVAGSVEQGANDYAWVIWRYNPDGSLDSTFGSSGLVGLEFAEDGGTTLDARPNAVVIQTDGKIVVGGYSETATNGRDMTIVRLSTTGLLDTAFDTDGIWTRPTRFPGDDEVTALALQPDGQIVLAGWRTFTAPDTDFIVTRLSTTGVIDTNIDTSVLFDLGNGNTDKANAIALQPDGMIVVAGSATTPSNGTDIAVARITTFGNLDTDFDSDGQITLRFAEAILTDNACGVAIQADGKIIIGGSAQTSAGNAIDFGFLRLNADGSYDTSFDGDGKQTAHFSGNDIPSAMVVQPDGKIVLAGLTTASGADTDPLLVRVNADGTMDTSFDGDGIRRYTFDLGGSLADTLRGVALDASGRIVAVGSAQTTSNGTDVAILRAFGKDIPLVVSTTADELDGNLAAGQLSLREAVTLANVGPGVDAITFQSGLGAITLTTGQLTLSDTSGATTIRGPATGTQVVQRSTAGGTPDFRIFDVATGVTATFANLTIRNGRSDRGGGVRNSGTLTLANSTVSGNTATVNGGGIRNQSGTLVMANSTISGNTAETGSGGGVQNSYATLTVTNSTISGNTAAGDGGGVKHYTGSPLALANVTLSGNRANSDNQFGNTGGGLFLVAGSQVTVKNTIVAGNFVGTGTTADDISGSVDTAASSFNLIGTGGAGGLVNGTNGNQVGVADAKLGPLANNGGPTMTHAPLFNSPALNAAQFAGGTLQVDQRGVTRDPIPDVGAFEVQNPLTPVGVPTARTDLYGPHPNASQNEAFVKSLYRALLGRDGDAGGVAAWVSALNINPAVRPTVVRDFYNSPENRGNQVTFMYRYFLNREPDNGGFNFWVSLLRNGTDEGVIVRDFLNSAEFTGSADNATFVNTMYYSLLGRASDPSGFASWVAALDAGTSRLVVTPVFMRSPESVDRVVTSYFGAFLRRLPTSGELTSYRNQVAPQPDPSQFTMTFGQAAISVLSTDEYFDNALPEVP